MSNISAAEVVAFTAKRKGDLVVVRKARMEEREDGTPVETPAVTKPVSNGEINRELQILKRCFNLAVEQGRLLSRPSIKMLREDNVRTGFFEPDQLAAVLRHLPADIAPVIRFAAITGWRVPSEVLPLQWRQVDLAGGEARLDPGTTKNREGRTFPLTAELRSLLEERWRDHERLRAAGKIVPWVFHRDGERIVSFHAPGAPRARQPACRGASRTTCDVPPFAAWCARAFPRRWR